MFLMGELLVSISFRSTALADLPGNPILDVRQCFVADDLRSFLQANIADVAIENMV